MVKKYPKCIYKEGEGERKDEGKIYKIVHSEKEEKQVLKDWGVIVKPQKEEPVDAAGEAGPEDLKVVELKKLLVEKYGHKEDDLKYLAKPNLIDLVKAAEEEA